MQLFTTPTSTAPYIFQAITENLDRPGLKGLTILVIGFVATFAIIEFITFKMFAAAPVDRRPSVYDDD